MIVMFNLLVSMLNDLYEELKGVAKADWCKAQVGILRPRLQGGTTVSMPSIRMSRGFSADIVLWCTYSSTWYHFGSFSAQSDSNRWGR